MAPPVRRRGRSQVKQTYRNGRVRQAPYSRRKRFPRSASATARSATSSQAAREYFVSPRVPSHFDSYAAVVAVSVFDDYAYEGFYDEVFDDDGSVRPHYDDVVSRLRALSPDELARRE